jgi:hypothetical protein
MTAIAAAMMTFLATTAVAKEGNLGVSATITPAGGCIPQVRDVDFGVVRVDEVPPAEGGWLPEPRATSLRVVCSVATKFAVRFTDLKADSVPFDDASYFGLGEQADGHKLGGYTLRIYPSWIKMPARYVTTGYVDADFWSEPVRTVVDVGEDRLYGFAITPMAVGPDALIAVEMPLVLSARIAPGFDTTQDVALQGEALIELVLL